MAGPEPKSYSYDAAGNVIGDGSRSFGYDARGRLNQVTQGTTTYHYLVNGLGQRVYKIQGATIGFAYVYDTAGHLLGNYYSGLLPVNETVYLYDTPVAVLNSSPAFAGNGIFYVEADQLNTPRAISDTTNKVIWRWDSAPFGTNAPNEDPDGDGVMFSYNLRFPGQYYDAESGLHYNIFRDYDPSIGRYVQSDPIGLRGGINTYLYANANPLSFTDPLGLDPFGSNSGSGSGGFTPAPTPFDVFVPGTPANNAFVQSVHQMGQAIKNLCSSDTPREECKKECVAQYERDAQECSVAYAFWGKKGYQACMSRAGEYLAQCTRQCDGK